MHYHLYNRALQDQKHFQGCLVVAQQCATPGIANKDDTIHEKRVRFNLNALQVTTNVSKPRK